MVVLLLIALNTFLQFKKNISNRDFFKETSTAKKNKKKTFNLYNILLVDAGKRCFFHRNKNFGIS